MQPDKCIILSIFYPTVHSNCSYAAVKHASKRLFYLSVTTYQTYEKDEKSLEKSHSSPDPEPPEPTELVSFSWSFKPCEDSSDPSDNGRKRECDPPVPAPCGEPSQFE